MNNLKPPPEGLKSQRCWILLESPCLIQGYSTVMITKFGYDPLLAFKQIYSNCLKLIPTRIRVIKRRWQQMQLLRFCLHCGNTELNGVCASCSRKKSEVQVQWQPHLSRESLDTAKTIAEHSVVNQHFWYHTHREISPYFANVCALSQHLLLCPNSEYRTTHCNSLTHILTNRNRR